MSGVTSVGSAESGAGLRMGTSAGRWVLACTIAGSGMAMLDGTVVNVALARIGLEFKTGFSALQWITNGYTLSLAALILIGGVLGDRFGRRRVFVIGACWFTVASVLCALSPSAGVLIAARVLQGIGAALLTPGSLAIISAEFAPSDRSRAVGAWSGLGGVATAIGPLLGGWLTDVNWRLVFFINVPLAAFVVWIAVRHVPESRDEQGTEGSIDFPGVALVIVLLAGLTYALTEAGTVGWTPTVIAAGLAGLAAGVAFVWVERRSAQPLIRLELFADRLFAMTNLVTLFVYAGLSIFFFLLTLQLQLVSGWAPLPAGLTVLPVTVLMLLLSARFGGLSDKVGPRPLMSVGALLGAAGFVLTLRIGPHSGYSAYLTEVLPAVLFLGLGLSCLVAPLTATVLGAAPSHFAGAASGINNAVARSAGLLAVAVIPAAAGLSDLGAGGGSAFQSGFHRSMLAGAGLMVVAALVSWFGLGRRGGPARTTGDSSAAPVSRPDPVTTDARVGADLERLEVHTMTHCSLQCPPSHPADGPNRPASPDDAPPGGGLPGGRKAT